MLSLRHHTVTLHPQAGESLGMVELYIKLRQLVRERISSAHWQRAGELVEALTAWLLAKQTKIQACRAANGTQAAGCTCRVSCASGGEAESLPDET